MNISVQAKNVHPDVRGHDCRALSNHIDLAPTLLAMAGMDRTRSSEFAGRELPGKHMTAPSAREA